MCERFSAQHAEVKNTLCVLIVDDEELVRAMLAEMLCSRGCHVLTASEGRLAVDIVGRQPVDLVLLDVRMPGLGGIETLKRIKSRKPDVAVTVLTGFGSVETAVDAMKSGADDFLRKPFSQSALEKILRDVERGKPARSGSALPVHSSAEDESDRLVAHDPVMRKTIEFVDRIAPLPSTVLIEGESGTGKELIARRIHRFGGGKRGRFVAFNCAAIPEHLLESELFGYEKGAFTGAAARKIGYFEAAEGGTIFIDEISEMSGEFQTKLLRVLQERTFRRVGGIEEIATDARIIAATNRDLEDEVAAGRFRKDLYYRVNVLTVSLPPLRDRPNDIPLLCSHFIERFTRRLAAPVSDIQPAALECLMGHRWPGNVRELQNVVERAVAVASGREITVDDLPPELRTPRRFRPRGNVRDRSVKPYQKAKFEFETEYLARALEQAGGNVALASRMTGITRQHFYDMLARHDLAQTEFRRTAGGVS